MKTMIVMLFREISLIIGRVFFDKHYLKSRWFTESFYGSKWIWRSIRHQFFGKENKNIPWPVSQYNTINGSKDNIVFDCEDIDNFQGKGCYFQCFSAKIYIGKGTQIANNVAIITANHDLQNVQVHTDGEDVVIGKNCWIGFGAVLLPGVVLGDNTVVGAGAVVTKSFEDGHCVVGGVPARLIHETSEE